MYRRGSVKPIPLTVSYWFRISRFESYHPHNMIKFKNFFITGNAWGAFSINSHINQHTGKPKVMYNTIETAKKSAEAMSKKRGVHFSYYKCLFCDGYHVGKNRDNKI